ncbi:SdrD B-like domain-containing protein [Planktothrix mougeotii]|uniref:SD-repeat containing protein B domain-containing protein n=1 Tax=Planktothrix mougeotii LEGE 06226 TaxID=1828728 RepID=A0ABR9UBY6_9CYAN|nr:SdrD B-like domain-containing protein [Planktothrix mougeotii]MBE9143696.1 hypothetical protein [Planktothrix mougeotii LEGE 06226]
MSTLNGTTFNDINFNGIFDAGDLALPNVTVFLDSNGNGLPESLETVSITDINGFYSFPNLAAGSYQVGQVVPPGFTRTTIPSPITLTGAADTATFNIANTGAFTPVVPSLSGNIAGAVFVDNNLLGLYNYVYDDNGNIVPYNSNIYDSNGNLIVNTNGFANTQIYDPFTDATLPNIPVYIDLNNDGFLNSNEPSTFTNEAGFYNFNVLPAGSYLLRIAQPSEVTGENSILGDLLSTTNTPLVVDVFGGSTVRADLGVVAPNSVYGKVINDLNGNGFPEASEPGIQGVTVFIDSNGNNVFDLGEKSTTSGADGAYIIKGLDTNVGQQSNETLAQNPYLAYQLLADPLSVANTFPVTSVPPTSSYVRTSPLPGATIDAPVIPAGSAQANFLYTFAPTATAVLPDSITGFVFNDLNGDGIVQPGEPNLPGAEIYLDLNNNNALDSGERSVITDAAGSFGFLNLPTPGDYIVRTTDEFLTTAVPNVILGVNQAAQVAVGLATFEPSPAINQNALIPILGTTVV